MKRFGFVMEQTLGHVTHHRNLVRWVQDDPSISAVWMPIIPEQNDIWEQLPVIKNNWSLKSSLRAKDSLNRTLSGGSLDALFLHTQTVALFSVPTLRKIPGIVSLDATPLNYDTVGDAYGHKATGTSWLEKRKFKWNQSTFEAAAHLITWCQWAKSSLVNDYHIASEKVTVIPPGVDIAQWSFDRTDDSESKDPTKLRLLFVGGDFVRKGGKYLLNAYRKDLQNCCTLDIVTKEAGVEAEIGDLPGVSIHRGLTPNCDKLRTLYSEADLFVFPTLADCLPIAVMEAMAAGLPVVTTNVGALNEEVEDGINGLVISPADSNAVLEAVKSLAENRALAYSMGKEGRKLAEQRFDACRNYNAILDLMKKIAR